MALLNQTPYRKQNVFASNEKRIVSFGNLIVLFETVQKAWGTLLLFFWEMYPRYVTANRCLLKTKRMNYLRFISTMKILKLQKIIINSCSTINHIYLVVSDLKRKNLKRWINCRSMLFDINFNCLLFDLTTKLHPVAVPLYYLHQL